MNQTIAYIIGHVPSEAILSLFALAFIVSMPEEPPRWGNIWSWHYKWLHDGLKTFVSFRSPAPPKA